MKYPWQGAARPMPPDTMVRAADKLGCEIAALRAVWDVEASGRGFLKDGSLVRRFEPHKMPGATTGWRDSLKIGAGRRDALLREAYARAPDAALRATSWGAPQIMGFNAHEADYPSALEMVMAMADDEAEHVAAFVRLVRRWGIDAALRAHDWLAFARVYNGTGQADAYAARIESAYRKHAGQRSPEVLRRGASGPSVRELQRSLGLAEDGAFGPATDAAVRAFQGRVGLPVDGIVGARTWAALAEARPGAPAPAPRPQPARGGQVVSRATEVTAMAGTRAAALEGVRRALPEGAYDLLGYGLVAGALVVAAVLIMRRLKSD